MNKVYSTPKVKKQRNLLKYGLSVIFMLLVLFVTLYFLLKDASLEEIRRSLLLADLRWVTAGFALMLLHQLCVAEILRQMLIQVVGVDPPYLTCLNTAFIGFYFNNITPSATGGQPMEMYYLYRCKVDIAGSSIIFMVMTMLYNFALLIYGIFMYFWQHTLVSSSLFGLKYVLIFSIVFNLGLLLICFGLTFFPHGFRKACLSTLQFLLRHRLIRSSHVLQRVERFFEQYSKSASQLWHNPALLLRLCALSFLQLAALHLVPFCAGRALGAEASIFVPSIALQAVLTLAASGFPTPGAVGLTESGFVAMFSSVIPAAKVMPAMILTRVINLYAFLLLSGLLTILAFMTAGSQHSHMRRVRSAADPVVIPEANISEIQNKEAQNTPKDKQKIQKQKE